MAKRKRPKINAKSWADQPDSGFRNTLINLPDGASQFALRREGVYRLEIIPYEVPANPKGGPNPNAEAGDYWYERTFFTHNGVGIDQQKYVCPAKTASRPCPICEERRRLMNSRDADEDLIKELAPKQRQLWNVYDNEEPDKGVQVWEISFHLFGRQLKEEIRNADEDDGYEYFADPDEGLTLRVGTKEKSFGGRTFYETSTVGFKPRKQPLDDEILEGAHVLDDLLIVLSYDKLKSIFFQEEGPADEDDAKQPADEDGESEEKPKRESMKTAAPSDDDEDWDTDFDDEQESKPEPSKGKGSGRKDKSAAPKPDTSDDDDDDWDDDFDD